MSIEPSLVDRVHTRSVLWRSGLLLVVLLLVAGVFGIGYAGRGLHSESVRVAGVPVEIVLALVTPLIGALLALYLLVAGVAWLTGMPWWRTIPAGALVVAWPVATALPIT
ncbi:hypothetical protein AB0J90_27150 [Micromonospora sp. NPDC049523]|uniref:hypothetical protein n=1 Tax=Micromonospora sp. NPDC049523 TaxID=3155921 RepID=UPI003427ABC7